MQWVLLFLFLVPGWRNFETRKRTVLSHNNTQSKMMMLDCCQHNIAHPTQGCVNSIGLLCSLFLRYNNIHLDFSSTLNVKPLRAATTTQQCANQTCLYGKYIFFFTINYFLWLIWFHCNPILHDIPSNMYVVLFCLFILVILTHWRRVTHICVVELTIIGSNNGLAPGRRQAIIWTNAGILLIGPLGTNFFEILVGIQTFSFKKMHLKVSSAKWRPFCLGLNELKSLAAVSDWFVHSHHGAWIAQG